MDTCCVILQRTTPEFGVSEHGTVPPLLCFVLHRMPPFSPRLSCVPFRNAPLFPSWSWMPSVRSNRRSLSIGTDVPFEREEPSDGNSRGFGRRRWRRCARRAVRRRNTAPRRRRKRVVLEADDA